MDGRASPKDAKRLCKEEIRFDRGIKVTRGAGWSVSDEQRKYEMTKEGENELQRSELLGEAR